MAKAKSSGSRRPRDTRARLIEVGTELIWEFGYSDVSIDDVLGRVGALKGSFYHFFPSKQEFLLACLDTYWASMSAELAELYAKAETPAAAIHEHLLWLTRMQEQNAERYGRPLGGFHQSIGAEAHHMAAVIAKIEAQSSEHETLLRNALLQLQADGEIPDAAALLTVINYCIDGALYKGRFQSSLEPIRTLPDLIAGIITSSGALVRVARSRG